MNEVRLADDPREDTNRGAVAHPSRSSICLNPGGTVPYFVDHRLDHPPGGTKYKRSVVQIPCIIVTSMRGFTVVVSII